MKGTYKHASPLGRWANHFRAPKLYFKVDCSLLPGFVNVKQHVRTQFRGLKLESARMCPAALDKKYLLPTKIRALRDCDEGN